MTLTPSTWSSIMGHNMAHIHPPISLEIAIIERHLQWLRDEAGIQEPVSITPVIGGDVSLALIEKAHILAVYTRTKNVSATARIIKVSRRQLHRRLKKWGIEHPRKGLISDEKGVKLVS